MNDGQKLPVNVALAQSFKQLACEHPVEKITIKQICLLYTSFRIQKKEIFGKKPKRFESFSAHYKKGFLVLEILFLLFIMKKDFW